MKKIYLILAAAVGMTITSCTSNDFLGDVDPNAQAVVNDGSIRFGSGFKGMTRGDNDHVGQDAATKLNNKFIVSAFKGDGSTMTTVINDYIVSYGGVSGFGGLNTAGTTTSNTSDWEYVGIPVEKPSSLWKSGETVKQTIKYWDYATDQYDFVAYSTGDASVITEGDPSTTSVLVSAIAPNSTYGPTYTLKGSRDNLAKCYIADMVTAYKATKSPAQPKFQDEVKFEFRNLACKVRVALYETIPGYSVTGVKFYLTDGATIGSTSETNFNLFTQGGSGTENAMNYFYTAGEYTVSFPHIGDGNRSNTDYNKAHVAFVATGQDTKESFGAVNYGGGKEAYEVDGTYLGRTLPGASYAGTSAPYYKTMLPNEVGTVLELRVDYTLVPIDGAAETIKVYGAKAFVPAIYAAWKPNYAYTYVFKISDNTNGWTDPTGTDPAGLYPITFDAIVVDADEFKQSTITTVAMPSITTYQLGHNPATGNAVIGVDEYDDDKGKIYIQVMNGGTLATNLTGDGISKLYVLTGKANPTEADVMDALNIQAYGSSASTVLGRNGVTLTAVTSSSAEAFVNTTTAIPGVNGNDITVASGTAAEFTPISDGTSKIYAYVYYTGTENTDTNIYSAIHFAKDATKPADWSGNYWDNPDGTGSALGDDAFDSTPTEGVTYYRHYTNDNKVYGVKIIKVVD